MSNKAANTLKTALGLAFISSSLAAPMSALAENPFFVKDLGSGYQVAAKDAEGKCGEGKCGENKGGEEKTTKDAEGKCGEGKGGDDKAAKGAEGKCGEGKGGENK